MVTLFWPCALLVSFIFFLNSSCFSPSPCASLSTSVTCTHTQIYRIHKYRVLPVASSPRAPLIFIVALKLAVAIILCPLFPFFLPQPTLFVSALSGQVLSHESYRQGSFYSPYSYILCQKKKTFKKHTGASAASDLVKLPSRQPVLARRRAHQQPCLTNLGELT